MILSQKYILTLIVSNLKVLFCASFYFNEQISKDLAAFSLLSYTSNQSIKRADCGSPCKRINPLEDLIIFESKELNLKGFLGFSPQHSAIIIAMRGSKLSNWWKNMEIFHGTYKYCECSIHKGFNDNFQGIKNELETAYRQIRRIYPYSNVYLTGHSLGGALATLSVPLIFEIDNHRKIDILYTFGEPKVGAPQFQKWFDGQSFIQQQAKVLNELDQIGIQPQKFGALIYQGSPFKVLYNSFSDPEVHYRKCYEVDDSNCNYNPPIFLKAEHQNYYGWNWRDVGE